MSSKSSFLTDLALLAVSQIVVFYGVRWAMSALDPQAAEKKKAKEKSARIRSRLGFSTLELDEYEEVIAAEIIHPDDINISFKDVGGLDEVLGSLKETVLYPLVYPELFSRVSPLLSPPKGVLLYGPPGCGKTMIAKALAKESGATFINMHISTLTNKWFGESQKLVKALFSLARKLQPTIVFIDEIDSFLRERQSNDHEATSMMKAEFMTLWDGLSGPEVSNIVILGATNRPNDIDKAILRRMPKRFAISLPDTIQRRRILSLLLKNTTLDSKFDFENLLEITDGYSGSDLKELCRAAAMIPVRESIKKSNPSDVSQFDPKTITIRPLSINDFLEAKGIKNNATVLLNDLD